jgi:hypothetical protein
MGRQRSNNIVSDGVGDGIRTHDLNVGRLCSSTRPGDLPKGDQFAGVVTVRFENLLVCGGAPANGQCPLLPKLLPNAVARSGTETNEEPSSTAKVLTNRDVRGCTGIIGDGGERISSAVLSATRNYRPRGEEVRALTHTLAAGNILVVRCSPRRRSAGRRCGLRQ